MASARFSTGWIPLLSPILLCQTAVNFISLDISAIYFHLTVELQTLLKLFRYLLHITDVRTVDQRRLYFPSYGRKIAPVMYICISG